VSLALRTKHLEMDFQDVCCAALVNIGQLKQVYAQYVQDPHIKHKTGLQCVNLV